MATYHRFARFYDPVMGNRKREINLVKKCIRSHFGPITSLLEFGCGTGSILEGFKGVSRRHGVDTSPQMLQIAQQKLPNVHFTQADIRSVNLGQKFEVVICLFDTINHLPELSDWDNVFERAAAHLQPNGLFIFDMVTEGRIAAEAAMPEYIQSFKGGQVSLTTIGLSRHRVKTFIQVQEHLADGTIQVHEEDLIEASFELGDVRVHVTKHFEILACFTPDGSIPSDTSGRVYFACRPR